MNAITGAETGRDAPQASIDNTLRLRTNGEWQTGWEEIRVTRSIERVPADFDITMTARYPDSPAVTIHPGDSCAVYIGADLVITGYVDRYEPSISPRDHRIRVSGRSKCEDLVDCSAGINADGKSNGLGIITSSVLQIAQQFASPFNITASVIGGADVQVSLPNGSPIFFNISLTDSPMQIIEEVARYAALLVYDGPDGNLLFANVGASTMASGFKEYVNVQEASVAFTMNERFSTYVPTLLSTDTFADGPGENGQSAIFAMGNVADQGVPRFRPLIIVSEQTILGYSIATQRAIWEMNRRRGRSQSVRLVCDSWRDANNQLWQPNAYAAVDIPALGIVSQNWIIATVSYVRSLKGGTVAEVTLMPDIAFMLEPSTLQPYDWQVWQDPGLNSGVGDTSSGTPSVTQNIPGYPPDLPAF